MKNYCVSKIGNIVVDSSDIDLFDENTMTQNALSAGFSLSEIEIISEDEFKRRESLKPQLPKEPTLEEKVIALENTIKELKGEI